MSFQGPLFTGTVSEDNSVGAWSWGGSGASGVQDGAGGGSAVVSVPLGNSATTYRLNATNFGFNIPIDATINGVIFEWRVHTDYDDETAYAYVSLGYVIKGGTLTGSNNSSTNLPTTLNYISFGSSTTIPGSVTLTSSDVNASNFGFGIAIAVEAISNDTTVTVDAARATVYYTEAGGSSVQSQAALLMLLL